MRLNGFASNENAGVTERTGRRISKWVGLILLGMSSFVSSLSAKAQWTEYGRVRLPRTPHYVFKVFPQGNVISYSSAQGNFLMMIDWYGSQRIISYHDVAWPGTQVVVPSQEEETLLFVPQMQRSFFGWNRRRLAVSGSHSFGARKPKIDLSKTIDFLFSSMNPVPLRQDVDGTRFYNLVGDSVREIGASVQMIGVKNSGEGSSHPRSIVNHRFPQRRLCPNLELTLPVVSKSGKLLAAIEPESRNTQVIDIDQFEQCKVTHSLNQNTGPVDFSPDDKKIAFHAETEIVGKKGNFQTSVFSINTFTYDLSSKNFEPVTLCDQSNCFYPQFMKNGDLVILEQSKNSKDYYFVFLKESLNSLATKL